MFKQFFHEKIQSSDIKTHKNTHTHKHHTNTAIQIA